MTFRCDLLLFLMAASAFVMAGWAFLHAVKHGWREWRRRDGG